MKVTVPVKWWCCDHGWHGWHEAEIEVDVEKHQGVIYISLDGVGDLKCNFAVTLDTKKKIK